ncbi:hypothetical protein DNTS_033239 [Danionella cerebrum]|uniref:Agouti domain-containing protein n=1 Tax=Danionella cerebrum TaxID=2873325 RepID=A0A553MPN1_9TELE|nr:hypothetical protein DNTS_033239 [Danionella translucida]
MLLNKDFLSINIPCLEQLHNLSGAQRLRTFSTLRCEASRLFSCCSSSSSSSSRSARRTQTPRESWGFFLLLKPLSRVGVEEFCFIRPSRSPPFNASTMTVMMRGFVLFVCLFFTAVQSITCEDNRIDARKKHENDAAHHGHAMATGVWSQEKPKRLFARTRYMSQQRHHLLRPKPKPEAISPVQTPVRRCAGLTESCSPLTPCCDACTSCHCRLFNTICHCWRLGHLCPKKI